jgi:Domain of Unknown Function (DUF1521)
MINSIGALPVIFIPLETGASSAIIGEAVLTHPIAAPVISTAVLPDTVDVVLYDKPKISGVGGFVITNQSIGGISFDLTDGYWMSVDERESAVYVANNNTKESVRIWGAAEIQLDGAKAARFWGTTSVILGNGAKITLETIPDAKAADIFRLDRMTVTLAERAMVITGVSSDTGGDLAVVQSNSGRHIDFDTRDGLVLKRNALTGWADEYGVTVSQELLDATAVGRAFGPGSDLMSLGEFRTLISRFMTWGMISSMMSLSSRALTGDMLRQEPTDVARVADLRRSWARHADEAALIDRGQVHAAERRTLELSF